MNFAGRLREPLRFIGKRGDSRPLCKRSVESRMRERVARLLVGDTSMVLQSSFVKYV